MLSGAGVLEMLDSDGGSALKVLDASVGDAKTAPVSSWYVERPSGDHTTLRRLTKTPGGRERAWRSWTGSVTVSGSDAGCVWASAR